VKTAYRVLAYLIALGVVLQAAWMALGGFTMIKEVDDGLIVDKNYEVNFGQSMHGMFGVMVIPALALLLLIISFFAKVNGGIKWAAIVFGVVVLQVVLAFVAFGVPAVGILHGPNALVLLGVAVYAGRLASQPKAEQPADTQPLSAA
jgi:hypothetical protein